MPTRTLSAVWRTHSRKTIHQITSRSGRMTARVLTLGATLQSLHVQPRAHSLVLGFTDVNAYFEQGFYCGATIGRVANRIAGGRFDLNGQVIQTERNDAGRHTLHGGSQGLHKVLWTVDNHNPELVTLGYFEPHGTAGFPGNVDLRCTYALFDRTLRVTLNATTDRPTPINLTHHPYFCLDGSGTIDKHVLQIDATRITDATDDNIANGLLTDVADTDFDFRTARPIASEAVEPRHYDTNFCVADERRPLATVAELRSPESGVSMRLRSTEPGVHFYSGQYISSTQRGHLGKPYGPRAGVALEAQVWPNAVNHAHFPSIIVQPGETLEQIIEYQFS
ncbi:MAG: aldose epimerase family protein [Gammaproteobacteria bacterium]